MAYKKDGADYSEKQLRKDNPLVSFPRNALTNAEIRSDYNVTVVDDPIIEEVPTPTPLPDREGFRVVNGEYVELTYAEKRFLEYGPVTKQIEFITENGLEAWQAKVAEIKAKYPQTWEQTPKNDSELAQAYDRAMTELRSRRNQLLASSDWTQVADVALTVEDDIAWRDYRVGLRNLPAGLRTADDVANVDWPTAP